MKRIRLVACAFVLAATVALMTTGSSIAQTPQQIQNGVDSIGGENTPSLTTSIETIVNLFLFLIGAVAVVMLIYSGFRYVTSAGDTAAVASAKNTIVYAVVGLVVAITAYAISDFVIGEFTKDKPLTAEQCQQIPVELRYHEEECL